MSSRKLIGLEIRGAASTGHLIRVLPLAVLTPFVSLWPQFGSPFIPALVAAFLSLEPFYNNTLNTWPGQLTAYGLLPADWIVYLRAKNCATALITLGVVSLFMLLTAFMQPVAPNSGEATACALYLLSILFPLLAIGNVVSWQQPRARIGWGLEDAAADLVMLLILGLVSLPYALLSTLEQNEVPLLIYSGMAAVIWWHEAIPRAAKSIHERFSTLWHKTQTSLP